MTDQIDKKLILWQKKLLPFVIYTITIASLLFLIISAFLTYSLQQEYKAYPSMEKKIIEIIPEQIGTLPAAAESELIIRATLEEQLMQQRYHQATYGNLSIIWFKYLGILVGMILCLFGGVFILSKISTGQTNVEGSNSDWKFSLSSTSPGVIFSLLGALIIVTTIQKTTSMEVNDKPNYLAPIHMKIYQKTNPLNDSIQ